MTQRKVVSARIRKNTRGEWVVICRDGNGIRIPEADYYTDDKQDAEATLAAILKDARKGEHDASI